MQSKSVDVEVIDVEHSFKGFFNLKTVTLKHKLFSGVWGPSLTREIFVRGEAAGVLLYDPLLDKVALVEQFRMGALPRENHPWLLELVAGIVDKDESIEDLVCREAKEEADCSVQRLEFVAEYYNSPGGSDEYFYLYCGKTDLTQAGGVFGLAEEGEDIRVHVLDYDQAITMLSAGKLNNAQTIIALQWLQLNRERLQREWS